MSKFKKHKTLKQLNLLKLLKELKALKKQEKLEELKKLNKLEDLIIREALDELKNNDKAETALRQHTILVVISTVFIILADIDIPPPAQEFMLVTVKNILTLLAMK